jgi:hypothetical protein
MTLYYETEYKGKSAVAAIEMDDDGMYIDSFEQDGEELIDQLDGHVIDRVLNEVVLHCNRMGDE